MAGDDAARMRHDFSWKASAKEYEKLYDMLLGN